MLFGNSAVGIATRFGHAGGWTTKSDGPVATRSAGLHDGRLGRPLPPSSCPSCSSWFRRPCENATNEPKRSRRKLLQGKMLFSSGRHGVKANEPDCGRPTERRTHTDSRGTVGGGRNSGTIKELCKSVWVPLQDRRSRRRGMMSRSFRWQIALSLLIAVTGGCGSPALFEARTEVHSDGSCDRTIWQPEGEMLPAEALQPPWKARWKTVAAAAIPPAFAKDHQPDGEHHYFMAQGSFRKPEEIPAHFRHVASPGPQLGASQLQRAYKREFRLRRRAPLARDAHEHRDPRRLPQGPRSVA